MLRFMTKKQQVCTQPFIPDPPEDELGDDRFSRLFKPWREWSNVVDFLTNLHIGADESQVFCSPIDPPDVLYKDAAFEVKEIMDEGRRRHDEVKKFRQNKPSDYQAEEAGRRFIVDLLPIKAGELVLGRLGDLTRYKAEVKERTDLLFYINKRDHWFDAGPMPSAALFKDYGWRSVSAVIQTKTSLVFYASDAAPQFLQDNAGRFRLRDEPLDFHKIYS